VVPPGKRLCPDEDSGTTSQRRIVRSEMRVKESRLLIEQANITRLASIAAAIKKIKLRAAENKKKGKGPE
jgi:hypothetical protein